MMRLPWNRTRIRVDLDPTQVIIVRFLVRFGPAPASKLYDEVTISNGADMATFRSALAGLVEKDLLVSQPQDEGEAWFAFTPLGRKLRGKVPAGIRTALAVYI